MVILGIAFDLPDLGPTTKRLLRNAPDFGRLFACYYGGKAGSEICRLIKEHLIIAAELVKAAKACNNEAAADAEKRWYENADEIVCFLHHLNCYWTTREMKKMWYEHLALTKNEAVEILQKKFPESIETFNRIEKLALMMADEFSSGIACQFDL